MLRVRGWGWVLLVCWIVGCSSSSAKDRGLAGTTGGFWGGQTGSLAPTCAPGPSFDMEATVPAGDTALVYYDDTCTAEAADFALIDPSGDPIEFHLERLPGGGVIVKADAALAPGQYTVSTPKGTKTVNVTEPEPLPMTLGVLEDQSTDCSASLALTFSAEVKPYLPLLSLSYTVDGGTSQAWFDYGTLDEADQSVRLDLGALEPGAHEVLVRAAIAGESDGPDTLTFAFNAFCEGAGDGGGGGCAVVAARPLLPPRVAAWSWLTLLVFGLWRRRNPNPQ